MDLNGMSTEELADLLEAAQAELAGRQTQDAIVRDVTAAVDPIILENRDLLGGSWSAGRVSWDGHCMTVEQPPEDTAPVVAVAAEPEPEPAPYKVYDNIPAGAVIAWDDRLLRVTTGHQRTEQWNPDTKPGWFEEV